MKTTLFMALLLSTAAFGFGMGSQEPQDSMRAQDIKGDAMMKPAGAMKTTDNSTMVSDSDKMMAADPIDSTSYNLKGLGPQVVRFSTEAAAQALAKSQTVVYFFLPRLGVQIARQLTKTSGQTSPRSPNFTLIFVNYDKAADLKTKYGITAQHTFVVVGPMGEKKKVFNGTDTVADVIKTATM